MTEGRNFGKYLGYSIYTNKLERNDLQFLLENFKRRLAGWKANFLSTAGRATLIRSTLNSLPNHVVQLMKVPDHIIDQMERCERNFYWATTPTHKKVHLLKWSRITQPKNSGGLGIQDLRTKNKALLASTAWRLFQSPSSLWAKVLCSKYLERSSRLTTSSRIWKMLKVGWAYCRHGMLWRPTRGDRINFFHDPWFKPV